jgi:hypothetical protein
VKIPSTIYEALTPAQRVIAAVAAQARDDDEELERLKVTCPKVTYRGTDDAYAGTMSRLMTLSLAVEADLRGLVIDFLLAVLREEKLEVREALLVEIASIQTAFEEVLVERGISVEDMERAGARHHDSVSKLLRHCRGDEDAGEIARSAGLMREALA